ncbi:exosome complex exonuclease RRP6 [Blastomyces parvus]|uniref:Exosome complex exonuclease RRP6 n=1 Tax=Blastomyces parvus TaxID=2060905 RepID=A0A2B7X2C6_9EURO|nr:exosome complex exonuclease RRP6 [Blastomyces parvus]
MEIAADFAPYEERVQAALVKTTRSVTQITSEDLNFHRSFDNNLAADVDEESARLLRLTNSLLKVATSGSDLRVPELRDEDGLEENWRTVVDVIDELLEKADACLDEFTGIIKKLSPSQEERGAALSKRTTSAHFPSVYDFGPSKIPKPQLLFTTRPKNNDDASPFKPLLRSKPHAITPLSPNLGETAPDGTIISYKHPYETEIRNSTYPSSAYTISAAHESKPFETTTATFVDTLEGVQSMLAELKQATEIAIDLEHHDAHSYHGIVCLMQISTREKDWIVDTLKPWREELQILNEVFADPKILKVLHGSTMDVIWLQRDLGLYIVGLFDTYHAAVALDYPKKSLKFLLEKFVNFQAEKKYQMADWRLRPLLPGMFDYARSDTHYLLYIYDQIRNSLVEHSTPTDNLIEYVLEKSKQEALQRYERPVYNAETGQGSGGWQDMLIRNSSLFSREQFAVFRAVHQWRDKIARSEDEGVQYVLSKQSLFKIAHAMPLDPASLLRTISPVSPLVRARASELVQVIKQAKIVGATGPELRDVLFPLKQKVEESKPSTPTSSPESERDSRTVLAARTDVSQFWGPTLEQPPHPPVPVSHSLAATAEAFLLSLPLPSMPPKVSDKPVKEEPSSSPQKISGPTATTTNEIFTLKQFGAPKKRKISPTMEDEAEDVSKPKTAITPTAETPTASLSTDDSMSGASNSVSSAIQTKAQKRREKKKQKTASTLRQQGDNNDDGKESPNFTPFDYGNAESVLHANPTENGNRGNGSYRGKQKQKRQFNPYAKAMDAPQGMRKSKKEIEGKSFTFR